MDIAGTGMAGTDPVLRLLMERGATGDKRALGAEQEVKASQEREAAARAAQTQALAPKQAELKAKLQQGAPAAPDLAATPQAPTRPMFDQKEVGETLTMITALAALGGALTRAPLTAALNNFSAGVHGYVQGKHDVFAMQLREFDANLKKAHAENDSAWKKYQAAREKYKTDIGGLQSELKLIAAETQNPIDLELAKRGDVVSLEKMAATREQQFNKVLENVARIRNTMTQHAETKRHHEAMEQKPTGRGGVGAALDPQKRQDALFKEFHREKRKLQDRLLTGKIDQKTHDEELAMLTGQFKGRGMGAPAAPASAPATEKSAAAPPVAKSFATPEEADAAAKRGELTPGMRISIAGQTGTWQ